MVRVRVRVRVRVKVRVRVRVRLTLTLTLIPTLTLALTGRWSSLATYWKSPTLSACCTAQPPSRRYAARSCSARTRWLCESIAWLG